MTQNIKYVAELSGVKEVSLLGTADLSYWKEYLQPFGLQPTQDDKYEGRAQVLIIAASLRFARIPFQEVSFSVLVEPSSAQSSLSNGSFLLRAFNSSRLFAFSERFFFSTPYFYGQSEIMTTLPLKIDLSLGSERAFLAQMGASNSKREPKDVGEGGWDGPVFLPKSSKAKKKYFMAKITGQTTTYPFRLPHDQIAYGLSSARHPLFKALIDSGFEGKEWHVRPDAYHAKSKSYSE